MISYEEEIWLKAIKDAESDVMRCCPILVGGRKLEETIDQYVGRCDRYLKKALEKLAIARERLNEVRNIKIKK